MGLITLIILLAITGLFSGILSGVFGVGGGVIMIPLLILFFGFNQYQAQGTSLAVMLPPVTLLAVFSYHKEGYIDWRYAVVIAIFFIVGAYLGSRISLQIEESKLKKIFGLFLLVISLRLIFVGK